jgi:hypothetical protein
VTFEQAVICVIEYYTALRDGKQLEWKYPNGEWCRDWRPQHTNANHFLEGHMFRVVEAPKRRPFKPEESAEMLGRKVRWDDGEVGIITSLRGIQHRLHDQLKNLFENAVFLDGPDAGQPVGKVDQ